jgi:hypothetical protein
MEPSFDPSAKTHPEQFQYLDSIFSPNGGFGIENCAIDKRNSSAASWPGSAGAYGNFVILKKASLYLGVHIFLEIHGCRVGNLGRLVPPVEVTVAYHQAAAFSPRPRLRIDGILAGTLTGFESRHICF